LAQSTVSQNFILCLKELKDSDRIRSDREFALAVEFSPQNLSQIINGKREVTVELIKKAVEKFQFNPDYLFTGQGAKVSINKASPSIKGIPYSDVPFIEEKAEDRYVESLNNESKPRYRGLFYRGADDIPESRIFTHKNKDLSPYIDPGAKLICKRIDPTRWDRLLRDGFIYVVVTKSAICVSRIINNLTKEGTILLLKCPFYNMKNHILMQDEIHEIWEITHLISRWSPDLNPESKTLNEKLVEFENTLDLNKDALRELNKTMQKLLKQNREQVSMF
jgi:transcriptional regulator with XRE-family HTH domain